jgi:hypothetical protein
MNSTSKERKMKKIHTLVKYSFLAILIGLAVSHVPAIAQAEVPERSLEGVWEVTTTPRDCTTGEPIPAAAFVGLYTFHKDGTMTSWYATGTPATGHGLWRRKYGWSDYSFKLARLLRTSTTPQVFSGKQEIGGTLPLSESGDQYTSDEYVIVYSLDGVPGTPRCINSVGTRFKLE